MKQKLILLSFTLGLVGGLQVLNAQTGQVSEISNSNKIQKFVDKVRASSKSLGSNTQPLLDLYCWDSVDADTKKQTGNTISFLVKQGTITNVQFANLTPEFEKTQYSQGVVYEYNMPVIGFVKLSLGQGRSVKIPIGEKQGEMFFACQHRLSAITNGVVKDKFIGISISGNDLENGKPVSLQCSYKYIAGGQEMTGKITGLNNMSKSFWGESILICEVVSSVTNSTLDLDLTIDGKSVYNQASEATNKMVYIKE